MSLSKRAINVLARLNVHAKEDFINLTWRQIWFARGCGKKVAKELCLWAGRKAPSRYMQNPDSVKKPKLTPFERRIGVCCRFLSKHGYIVSKPPERA